MRLQKTIHTAAWRYALLIVILVSTATAMFESLTYFRADCADPIKDLGKREPINLLGGGEFQWSRPPTSTSGCRPLTDSA